MIRWLLRRIHRPQAAEMARADAWTLGILYEDRPVPFWPADWPSVLEDEELPYKPAGQELVDQD